MRRAAKRDAVESAVMETFSAHGCAVKQLSQADVADLLVSWPCVPPGSNDALRTWTGRLALCEVKSATGRMRHGQLVFRLHFPVWLVRSPSEAVQVIAWLKS